jgi:hypothetical protein
MGWRSDELWLDTDLAWFRDDSRGRSLALAATTPLVASLGYGLPAFSPAETGIEASRRRRHAKQAERKRRLATRTVPAVALVVGSATMLPMWALRQPHPHASGPLAEDPPSLTFRLGPARLEVPVPRKDASRMPAVAARAPAAAAEPAAIEWHRASAVGLPYSGRLENGTQLPVEGPDWVTWNPVTDSVPNLPRRLYAHERTIRALVSVITAYRAAHPNAPRVVVGDISFEGGGTMEQHVSHQNGLDVDVYYPRRDKRLSAPITVSQVDTRLTQELLDGFVAAGAQVIFVGYATGLEGPSSVVVPYPHHENHMHVRFPPPS